MSEKVRELRGLIYSKYDSEADLAREMGWTRQKVNKITNGFKEPNVNELNDFANALGKTVGEMALIFLNNKSPNEPQKSLLFASPKNQPTS